MRQFVRTVTSSDGRRTFVFDNRWVVPYNPYLSNKYDCHINVEVMVRGRAVKYIYKDIYKRPDGITHSVDTFDEISQYVNNTYLCPVEAVWKLMEFEMQDRSHTVVQLAIHLPDEQTVQYRECDNAETIEERRHTTLTRFFETCTNDPAAQELLYSQSPQHYVWERRHWRPRQRGRDKALGRMISVLPRDSARFYMHLLLCYRKGPTSFEDLRRVGNQLYDTYAEAVLAADYMEDENVCDNCLSEAVTCQMPRELRRLFAMLLVHCTPANPRHLWDKYLAHLADGLGDPTEGRVMLRLLLELEQYLAGSSKALSNFPTLPKLADYYQYAHESAASPGKYMQNLLMGQEEAYDDSTLDSVIRQAEKFDCEQRVVYEAVMSGVRDPSAQGRFIFLNGPGGTGKSFVLETILTTVCRENKLAIAVAGSGIAALLLTGGRTDHSTFHPSKNLTSSSTCFIEEESAEGYRLKAISLIVWDEAPMTHRHALEAVDRTLRAFMGTSFTPFGAKVVLLVGDFRQILPVV